MPEEITPQKVQQTVKRGFGRVGRYRRVTAMLVKEFIGRLYRDDKGMTGDEPLNLLFHTVSVMVPTLVMQNPITKFTTPYLEHKLYAELLSLGVDSVNRQIKLKDKLRAWIVNALFGLGILKIGLAAKGNMLKFGDTLVDEGQLYVENIGIDQFVIDPACVDLRTPGFLGHATMAPRQILLDIDIYDHDLVKRLPSAKTSKKDQLRDITQGNIPKSEIYGLQDMVDVVELWVPEANAIVTIPDPRQTTFDGYIGMEDFFGPKEGPYRFLSFAPPVQDNPLPVSPLSLLLDLHRAGNRMLSKTLDQADRQKDLVFYQPAQADEAETIRNAKDGDVIACSDTKGIASVSVGGQNGKNELMLQHIQILYNYIAKQPAELSGSRSPGTSKETATKSQILQSNASIGVEDARDILYDRTADVEWDLGWYLHTDPFINLPLIKRTTGNEEKQVFLTPEQRQGDYLEYICRLVQRSMSRLDPMVESQAIINFTTNILPAIMMAGFQAMQMGQQFNVAKAVTLAAEKLGIGDTISELFVDPEFQQKMQMMLAMGPQNPGKASAAGAAQNNGNPAARPINTPQQDFNADAQNVAADAQSTNQGAF